MFQLCRQSSGYWYSTFSRILVAKFPTKVASSRSDVSFSVVYHSRDDFIAFVCCNALHLPVDDDFYRLDIKVAVVQGSRFIYSAAPVI